MQKWEYRSYVVQVFSDVVRLDSGEMNVNEYLNMMGEQGWELVTAAVGDERNQSHVLYFKRPKR